MGAAFRWCRQRYERGQVTRLGITELPYPFAHDIGIDAVAQGNTGYRCARLQAFLNNLSFEGFWIRVSLAHGDPLTRAKNGVHLNRWTPSPLTLGSGRCVGRTLTAGFTQLSCKRSSGVVDAHSCELPDAFGLDVRHARI